MANDICSRLLAPILAPTHPLQAHDLLIDGLLVSSLIQQSVQNSRVRDLDLRDPAFALRAGVDGLGVVLKNRVAADDLARHGGEHVRSGLDRLDGTDGLTSSDFKLGLGELNEDDVAEGVGGVLGDTDLGCCARLANPPFVRVTAHLSAWTPLTMNFRD